MVRDPKAIDMLTRDYPYGFVTEIEEDSVPAGLSEDIIRAISSKKNEPDWMLEWRLRAYRQWLTLKEPTWANVHYGPIDYQAIRYYSAPKQRGDGPKSLAEVDPELLRTYERLGIPLAERELLAGVAVDAVFDSVSVATTFRDKLEQLGIYFCSFSEAVQKYPDLVQNWYPGDNEGRGGIYNFVTKRGKCQGVNSKISWTQVETGSAITWKYPGCILMGDNSTGAFYSVAVTNNYQQADTGTKMIHIGKNTKSTIVSKGISAGHGQNSYRGMVKVLKGAENARNYSQCDSLLIGDKCGAHTFPYLEVKNSTARVEHEASISKIGDDQIFYCQQRGLSAEDAVSTIINGFSKQVLQELPMEFAVEARKLLGVSLEGSIG